MNRIRYSAVAVALHWAIAILLLAQIAGGFYMHNLPNSAPMKFDLYQLHKSFGLSIFVLALVRLGWRLTHRPPALPDAMPGWQKLAARAIHWIFYFLMLAMPLVGLAIVSVSPKDIPTEWFGLIPVPHLGFLDPGADPAATEHNFIEFHEMLAYAILGLLGLHVAAALKHGFLDRDGVLRSMAPSVAAIIVVVLIFAGLGVGALAYLGGKSAPDPAAAAETMHDHDAHRHDEKTGGDEEASAAVGPETDETVSFADKHHDLSESAHRVEPAQTEAAQTDIEPVTDEPEPPASEETAAPAIEAIHGPCSAGIAENWAADKAKTTLRFIGEENERRFVGAFNDVDAEIAFNEANLAQSWLRVVVNTASAATGDQLIDSTLPGREWFNVKEHPVATFQSCDIRKTGDGAYAAHGALTVKSIERAVVLPFSLAITDKRASASGGVDLIRTDFNLGAAASWLDEEGVALEARVEFTVEAMRRN